MGNSCSKDREVSSNHKLSKTSDENKTTSSYDDTTYMFLETTFDIIKPLIIDYRSEISNNLVIGVSENNLTLYNIDIDPIYISINKEDTSCFESNIKYPKYFRTRKFPFNKIFHDPEKIQITIKHSKFYIVRWIQNQDTIYCIYKLEKVNYSPYKYFETNEWYISFDFNIFKNTIFYNEFGYYIKVYNDTLYAEVVEQNDDFYRKRTELIAKNFFCCSNSNIQTLTIPNLWKPIGEGRRIFRIFDKEDIYMIISSSYITLSKQIRNNSKIVKKFDTSCLT